MYLISIIRGRPNGYVDIISLDLGHGGNLQCFGYDGQSVYLLERQLDEYTIFRCYSVKYGDDKLLQRRCRSIAHGEVLCILKPRADLQYCGQ